MTAPPRLPPPARWLVRLSGVPRESQAEVEADLLELFAARRAARGAAHAHLRLYHDVASVWQQRWSIQRPASPKARHPGHPFALLRDASGDLRYAVRLFLRQPAILLLSIVGLSLGLGIATAAFSVMNAALRGEGLVDSARAPVVVRTTDRSVSTHWTYPEFRRLQEGATGLQVEAVLTSATTVRVQSETEAPSIAVAFVSGGFFAATGARVSLGRPLTTADEAEAAEAGAPPVVISDVFWTSRLNRDPAVIGRTIRVGRSPATIIGVAESRFSLPSSRLLWMPLTAYGPVYDVAPARRHAPELGVQVFGRLLPGVTLLEAQAQLSGVAAGLPERPVPGDSGLRVTLDPNQGLGRVSSADAMAITAFVSSVIALVLLLSCANVATILVSTAITREREMGVRAALGASRWRIVRQLVTESLALAVVAASLGLLLAVWAIPFIGRMVEAPPAVDLTPDLSVYLFLAIVTAITGVAAGLAPARHGRGADLVTPLKGDGARQDRAAPRRLRSMLVMTQAGVSVLLIVIASLFVRASMRAASVDVGFTVAGLYVIAPGLDRSAFEKDGFGIRQFWKRALSELPGLPGVAAVSLAEMTPFDGQRRTAIGGSGATRAITYFNRTDPAYFETLGLRLLAGRTYTRDEGATGAPVAVVSQSLARHYWQDTSPLGELLPLDIPIPEVRPQPIRPVIIGVVSDTIAADLHQRSAIAVYQPLDPASEPSAQLMLRVATDTEAGVEGRLAEALQRLRAIDPQADIRVSSVAARVKQETDRPRMLAALTGCVGAIAIVLCVIGLYGLTTSVVGQRAREMAVRVALGAERKALLRLLMVDSLRPVVMGLVVGAGSAWVAGRVIAAAILFGVSPQDPIAFAGAAMILLAAAMLAILVPTRRAASIDAASVLRRS